MNELKKAFLKLGDEVLHYIVKDINQSEEILEDIRKNVESLVFMELPGVKLELNVSGVCRPGKVDELLDQVRI